MDANVFIQVAKQKIAAQGLADYRFADFGKGAGMLAVATAAALDASPSQQHVRSRHDDPRGFDCVVRAGGPRRTRGAVNVGRSPFGSQVVARTPEVKRIAALPRRVWSEEAATALAAMLTRELKTPRGTMHLRPVQAIALYEAMERGGLFGPMRVGSGKTAVTLLCPLVLEAKRPLLLIPASLVEKTQRDRDMLAEHWRLPTNMQVVSYEMLGLVQSAQKLEYIRPDLIVGDEIHMLKNRRAGRTRRVIRFMREYPETRFVGVSGTVMKASISDFAHVLRWALKDNAPIPVGDDEVTTWAEALDEKVNPLARRNPEVFFDFGARPPGLNKLTAARQVFQARLLETPGVVASSKTDGVTCSLRVSAIEYKPAAITELHIGNMKGLHKQYLVPRIAWRLQANAEGDLSERARGGRAAVLAEEADLRIRPTQTFIKGSSEKIVGGFGLRQLAK